MPSIVLASSGCDVVSKENSGSDDCGGLCTCCREEDELKSARRSPRASAAMRTSGSSRLTLGARVSVVVLLESRSICRGELVGSIWPGV